MRAGFLGSLVVVGVVAAGCGAAAQQSAPASSHVVGTAFAMRHATQAAGTPVLSAGKSGVNVRAVPGGTFGVMLVFKNETHRQLLLENVRAVVPQRSFVRQLGTHIAPFFQCKPYCSRHMVMHGPFGTERPTTLHVRPENSAQAQLNFALAGCSALKSASALPITRAVVTYRDAVGTLFRQTIALGSSKLGLQSSGRIACTA